MFQKFIPKRSIFNFLKENKIEDKIDVGLKKKKGKPVFTKDFENHKHYPVHHEAVRELVLKRIIEKHPDDFSTLLDCTIGTAGHTKLFL